MHAQKVRMHAMRADITKLTEMICTLVTNQAAQVVQRDPDLHHDWELHDLCRKGQRGVRLYFSHFDVNNPACWVFKTSHYFEFHQTSPAQRLLMASYYMDGEALIWYQDASESSQFNSWETFTRALLTRFGSTAYDDLMEALTRLKQVTMVVTYKAQSEALSNRLRRLSETHKLSYFLSGQKDDIRLPVWMLNPGSLNAAFSLAKIQEEYLACSKKSVKGRVEKSIGSLDSSFIYGPQFSQSQVHGQKLFKLGRQISSA